MPWGWECRAKLVKQNPAKPTVRRGTVGIVTPGPNEYSAPQIFCGNGFDKIKRAPAYSFGLKTKMGQLKPATTPYARMFNVQGLARTGPYRIKHGVVSPQLEAPYDKTRRPGPGAHAPKLEIRYKRPPAYTMRPAALPPYQPWDQWTPPPNMYLPPIPAKKPPAYSMVGVAVELKAQTIPGPGEHEPNFNYVKKTKPAFSFGHPYRRLKPIKTPPPNIYCEKKLMVSKRSIPAPTFGIRHSPYIGQQETYLKSSKLDISLKSA